MDRNRIIVEYNITKAFRTLFLEDGKMKEEAEIIISYLRDVCGARGELGENGSPFFYDRNERFDAGAAAFALGKRRVFDLIVKHLALNETDIFNLISEAERRQSEDDVNMYKIEI